jgi:hypothetical protein
MGACRTVARLGRLARKEEKEGKDAGLTMDNSGEMGQGKETIGFELSWACFFYCCGSPFPNHRGCVPLVERTCSRCIPLMFPIFDGLHILNRLPIPRPRCTGT